WVIMTGVPLVSFFVRPLGIWIASTSRVRCVTGESVLMKATFSSCLILSKKEGFCRFNGIGTNLASYVDRGKKIVLSTFSAAETSLTSFYVSSSMALLDKYEPGDFFDEMFSKEG